MRVKFTPFQKQVMDVIINGTGQGDWADIQQIIDLLKSRHGKVTTRDNLQFVLRRLDKHGMIQRGTTEIRRHKRRSVIKPTVEGIQEYVANTSK